MSDEDLELYCAQIKDKNLKDTLEFGIGMHHAGLVESDRRSKSHNSKPDDCGSKPDVHVITGIKHFYVIRRHLSLIPFCLGVGKILTTQNGVVKIICNYLIKISPLMSHSMFSRS